MEECAKAGHLVNASCESQKYTIYEPDHQAVYFIDMVSRALSIHCYRFVNLRASASGRFPVACRTMYPRLASYFPKRALGPRSFILLIFPFVPTCILPPNARVFIAC